MCGLVGAFFAQSQPRDRLRQVVDRMACTITHRGPDDSGEWTDPDDRLVLGFRRLSILDLSAAGHQPMASSTGRFTVVFNGELYNHLDIRRELGDGLSYRGHSDTETLLAGFERWGIPATIARLAGMFAIAAWDHERRELSLARDRLGKKPLHVYRGAGVIAFASEMRALRELPGFRGTIDHDALATYLRHLYVPAPATILREVRKLRPGHILTLRSGDEGDLDGTPYWSPVAAAVAGKATPFAGSEEEAVDALDALLRTAVSQRLLSDVPVGALLSGGIDSSLVVGVMAECAGRAVRTYAVAFPGTSFDESSHAATVARHFDTTHTTFDLTERELLDVVPRMPDLFDEPHADPSCVPTYLISALTRRDVTVALTGDGGDEAFGGYNRYSRGAALMRAARLLPHGVRRALLGAGGRLRHGLVHRLAGGGSQQSGESRDERLLRVLSQRTLAGMYEQLVTTRASAGDLLPGGAGGAGTPLEAARAFDHPGLAIEERMMLFDQLSYLPDDLLAKLDRASMAASLEARAPLLDHRVIEFAWSLPLRYKIRRGTSKWILRRLLERRLPRAVFERPKMGFSSPISGWLRGPLRPWADALLADAPTGGALDRAAVAREWVTFRDGRGANDLAIWALLMYRAWEARWVEGRAISR